jgi:hypothetical protein
VRRRTHTRVAALGAFAVALTAPAPVFASGAWSSPTNVSGPGRNVTRPRIAVAATGEAVAVWRRFDGERSFIQAASRPRDGIWSAPTSISASRQGMHVAEPQIAIAPSGEAVAVWGLQKFENKHEYPHRVIQAASRPPGGIWSAPATISTGVNTANEPQIAIDDAGEAVAVWRQFPFVESASRPPGGAWSAPSKLSEKRRSGDFPDLAINGAGEAVAVWDSYDSTGNAEIVQSASRPPGGAWSAPTNLSKVRQQAAFPEVAIDAASEAVVVWESNFVLIQSVSRPPGGRWSAVQNLSKVPRRGGPFPIQEATDPQIAVNAAGEAVAVWGRLGLDAVVQSASRSPGGTWSNPTNVSPKSAIGVEPQVAVDASGGAVVVWRGIPRGWNDFIVQASSRPAGGAWSKPSDLSARVGNLSEPQIVISPAGGALAIWQRAGHRFSHSSIESADFGP